MSTRKATLSILAAGLVLAGCDAATPTGPTDAALAAPAAAADRVGAPAADGTMVPLTWAYDVHAVPGNLLACVWPDGSPVFLPDGTPVVIAVSWAFAGRASHLGTLDAGASTAVFSSCTAGMDPDLGPVLVGDAAVHLAGPQGDALDLTGTLTLAMDAGFATGVWDIVGGLGRFDGARGHLDTLEYPAADGAGSTGRGSGLVTRPGSMEGGR